MTNSFNATKKRKNDITRSKRQSKQNKNHQQTTNHLKQQTYCTKLGDGIR